MIRWSWQEIGLRLREVPMLRVFLPVACGVLLGEWLTLPESFLWVGILLCGALSLWARSSLYAVTTLLFLGLGVSSLHDRAPIPTLHKPLLLEVEVMATPHQNENYSSMPVKLTAWRDEQSSWRASRAHATLYCDSTLLPVAGEYLTLRSTIRPYSDKYPFYRSLQEHRGFLGTLHAGRENLLHRELPTDRRNLADRLHQRALKRLEALALSPENRAVAEAMSIGERRNITPELRRSYTRSGTSHLLAVSGLHVGIVFFGINLLLWGLPLLREGHRLRSLATLIPIWLYALITGASPSVLRAACMFSVLQLALTFTWHYHALNTLFGVATVMLLLKPDFLFDISFQLSFLAVAAILCWGVPLIRCLRSRLSKWLAGLFVVGLVSTLGTAPLVAYRFEIFAPIGILLNPAVIFTAQWTILLALTWILIPWPPMASLFSHAIETVLDLQNRLIETVASWEWASVEMAPSGLATALIYTLCLLLTLLSLGLRFDQAQSLKTLQNKTRE